MDRFSYYFINMLGILLIFYCSFLSANATTCVICLQPLDDIFSIDAWGNPFHIKQEDEGLFCHSCSRIISQGVTQGGYVYRDGRHLCSLCITTSINNDSSIQVFYKSVVSQLEKVGIPDIAVNIPITLVDLHQLNQEAGDHSHTKLKGFTRILIENKINPLDNIFHIYILFGLPQIEFEAVLAHELLHIWIHQNQIQLSEEEGFCNLGRQLIYQNDQTQFSTIHLQAMENDPDPTYGDEYRRMKASLEQKGWKNLIIYLLD